MSRTRGFTVEGPLKNWSRVGNVVVLSAEGRCGERWVQEKRE